MSGDKAEVRKGDVLHFTAVRQTAPAQFTDNLKLVVVDVFAERPPARHEHRPFSRLEGSKRRAGSGVADHDVRLPQGTLHLDRRNGRPGLNRQARGVGRPGLPKHLGIDVAKYVDHSFEQAPESVSLRGADRDDDLLQYGIVFRVDDLVTVEHRATVAPWV